MRRWATDADDINYELHLLEQIQQLGWPVAVGLGVPFLEEGVFWSLFPLLPGEAQVTHGSEIQQRMHGNLLARFHHDLSQVSGLGQRGTWRRCEAILADQTIDTQFVNYEAQFPEEIYILRWHLDRARERIVSLDISDMPSVLIHGDFTPWNVLFDEKKISGILDFELSHRDHRIGEFALSWRGKYDQVIHGYDAVSPLTPQEWALITPVWWAFLVELAYQNLSNEGKIDKWIIEKMLSRSPLMGIDVVAFGK